MGSLQKVRSKAEARNRSRFAETTLMDNIRTGAKAAMHAVQACRAFLPEAAPAPAACMLL
jgi:hypothetical protein